MFVVRVACLVAALTACKSSDAPPSPASGPQPATAPTQAAPQPAAPQPGTSTRSARVELNLPAAPAPPPPSTATAAQARVETAPEDRRRKLAEIHAQLDADHDGAVTVDELRRSALGRIDPLAADTNRDGVISVDELDAALSAAPPR
ncbi:MAG: EF-hand domain-containing protein [Deltaproteobacteria bacterium]|nr:EF-hand domain-containing protein [Deltaproteobacteria bacterium]